MQNIKSPAVVSYKVTSLTSLPSLHDVLYFPEYIFFLFPHLSWSHLSFSVFRLTDEENSPLSAPQLPPSLPAAFAQLVGNLHTRLIEFKDSLSPISVSGWDELTWPLAFKGKHV